MGRTTAFNATLFLTALFGVFASFAPTFIWLCISLFFLGSAVGVIGEDADAAVPLSLGSVSFSRMKR